MVNRLESYISAYTSTMKTLQSVMKEEESFEVTLGDVETIRSQKEAFKVWYTYDYNFLDKNAIRTRFFIYICYNKNNKCILFPGFQRI